MQLNTINCKHFCQSETQTWSFQFIHRLFLSLLVLKAKTISAQVSCNGLVHVKWVSDPQFSVKGELSELQVTWLLSVNPAA